MQTATASCCTSLVVHSSERDSSVPSLPSRLHPPGSVGHEEVSTIMRYLGAYPSEKAMTQEILPDMQARTSDMAVDRAQLCT